MAPAYLMKKNIFFPAAILLICMSSTCLAALEPEWTVFPDATFEPGLPTATKLPPPGDIGPRISAERRPIRERFEAPAEAARRHFTRMAAAFQIKPKAPKTTEPGEEEEGEESIDVVKVPPVREKMYEALFNIQDKLYKEAIPKLERVINEDPTLLEAWEGLGWAYWSTGQKQKSKQIWERLLALAPSSPMPHNLLGLLATDSGDLKKAGAFYEKSLQLDPNQYETRFMLAQNQVWQGELDKALPELRKLLKQDPDRLDIRLELARGMIANQEYEESLEHWTIIRKTAPDNVDYLLDEGRALLFIGDLRTAADNAERALELDEGNIRAIELRADIAEYGNKPADAIRELKKVLKMTENKIFRSRLMRRMALIYLNLYKTDEVNYPLQLCIDASRESIDLDPRAITMQLFLGEVYLINRDYNSAQKQFNLVLHDFNRENLRAKHGLFEVYMAEGQIDKAETQLADILNSFDPLDPFRYLSISRLEFAKGNYFEAMEALDRLEEEGARGAALVLLYHSLSPSEWIPMTSTRRFREHILALKRAGFKFITPDQLKSYFESRKETVKAEDKPFFYRLWRQIAYEFSGSNPLKNEGLREYSPEKIACITFDDALRSTFIYGTPIAEEMNLNFGMHVPVGNIQLHQIGLASWDELRHYGGTGRWIYGSHLLDAGIPTAVDREGYLVNPLPNRLWDNSHNRLETLRAYFARIRREFKVSRETMIKELELDDDDVKFAAYPYGDIGQESDSNITEVDSVVQSILNEAHMNYSVAFIQSTFGYTVKGDNPLLYQRYEPPIRAEARDVLAHAFEYHPVFMARRQRAEIAALQGKPFLAMRMLKELERDGYPDEKLKELSDYLKQHLAGSIPAPKSDYRDAGKKERSGLEISQPYVGAEVNATRANVQIDQWQALARAGVNVTPQLTLEVCGGYGEISQEFTSNVWKEVEIIKATTTREHRVTTTDGVQTITDDEVTTYAPQTVSTNYTIKRKFKSKETDYGGRAGYRFRDGSIFTAEFLERKYKGNITNQSANTFAGEYQWKPVLTLDMGARYQYDVIPSAMRLITYNSAALVGAWRIRDWWNLLGHGQYSYLSDDNSILRLNFNTDWLVAERVGFYLGLEGSFITADKYNPDYWTPYWEQRYYAVGRIKRSYPRFFGSAEVRIGRIYDRARQEDLDAYNTRKVLAEAQGWYPGDSPDIGWDSLIGCAATLRKQFWTHWEIYGEASVNAVRDYTEYFLKGGLTYTL